jgi:hypothetical protein
MPRPSHPPCFPVQIADINFTNTNCPIFVKLGTNSVPVVILNSLAIKNTNMTNVQTFEVGTTLAVLYGDTYLKRLDLST